MTFDKINNCTGFANGFKFQSEAQVLSYFTVSNIKSMFEVSPSQEDLDDMAQYVLDARWHCDF